MMGSKGSVRKAKNRAITLSSLELDGFWRFFIAKPGGVQVECSEDSKRFIAELIDRYGQPGWDRNLMLLHLRHKPVDRWRVWWERNNTYE
jgi:hypothetical protein